MTSPHDVPLLRNAPTRRTLYTAFDGQRRLGSGDLHEVALMLKRAAEGEAAGPLAIYDDTTGRVIDVDVRGSDEAVVARLSPTVDTNCVEAEPRKRGRPKLGVVAREVTLLPRHWEWLSAQPGGASVALRRIVDAARRTSGGKDRRRAAQEAAYHFASAMAGDLPGFEEAMRALFADDQERFTHFVEGWPHDIREHVIALAFGNRDQETDESAGV